VQRVVSVEQTYLEAIVALSSFAARDALETLATTLNSLFWFPPAGMNDALASDWWSACVTPLMLLVSVVLTQVPRRPSYIIAGTGVCFFTGLGVLCTRAAVAAAVAAAAKRVA